MIVVDLGSAPGGWSQVLSSIIKKPDKIFALDILPMDSIHNVHFIQGDFTEDSYCDKLIKALNGSKVDWVISDMAPNISGNKITDQASSLYLCDLALDFAKENLKDNGHFLTKAFQGSGSDIFVSNVKKYFKKCVIRKPNASRDRSREFYLLAQNYKGANNA